MTRDTMLLSLAALSVGCLLALWPAHAATPACAPRLDLVEILTERHGEIRQSIGLARNGAVIETFAAENGTWSILVTRPDGISCLLADGQHFEGLDETKAKGQPI